MAKKGQNRKVAKRPQLTNLARVAKMFGKAQTAGVARVDWMARVVQMAGLNKINRMAEKAAKFKLVRGAEMVPVAQLTSWSQSRD